VEHIGFWANSPTYVGGVLGKEATSPLPPVRGSRENEFGAFRTLLVKGLSIF